MDQENVKQFGNYIRGFESDSPEGLGEKNNNFFSGKSQLRIKKYKI